MKIAVASQGNMVSPHFGHCPEFSLYETENGSVVKKTIIPNPGHRPGFLPRFLAEKGVNCIIAGGMGPAAVDLFRQHGIETVIGASGSVDKVVSDYLSGSLAVGESACHH